GRGDGTGGQTAGGKRSPLAWAFRATARAPGGRSRTPRPPASACATTPAHPPRLAPTAASASCRAHRARQVRRSAPLESLDVTGMPQRKPDVVQTVQQPMLDRRVNVERGERIAIVANGLMLKVDRHSLASP